VAGSGWSGTALIECLDPALTGAGAPPNGCRIEGLFLNCNNLASCGIRWAGDARDYTIRDVEAAYFTVAGFLSEGNGSTPNQELNFYNCMAGLGANYGGWLFQNLSYDHKLIGCVSRSNSTNGFQVATGCASMEFAHCRAEFNTGHGFYCLSGDKITFHGCVTDRNTVNGWYIEYATGGPMLLSGCYANRDLTAGVRVHNSNITVIGDLCTRVGRNDDGTGTYGPIYGVDTTGTTKAMVQGYLQGTTAGYHDGGGGSTVKFSGTTGLHAGSPPSVLTWQAATS
jgi:hypothetical protein